MRSQGARSAEMGDGMSYSVSTWPYKGNPYPFIIYEGDRERDILSVEQAIELKDALADALSTYIAFPPTEETP